MLKKLICSIETRRTQRLLREAWCGVPLYNCCQPNTEVPEEKTFTDKNLLAFLSPQILDPGGTEETDGAVAENIITIYGQHE